MKDNHNMKSHWRKSKGYSNISSFFVLFGSFLGFMRHVTLDMGLWSLGRFATISINKLPSLRQKILLNYNAKLFALKYRHSKKGNYKRPYLLNFGLFVRDNKYVIELDDVKMDGKQSWLCSVSDSAWRMADRYTSGKATKSGPVCLLVTYTFFGLSVGSKW
jgi:hypothetical protein